MQKMLANFIKSNQILNVVHRVKKQSWMSIGQFEQKLGDLV